MLFSVVQARLGNAWSRIGCNLISSGITANMEKLGVTTAEKNAYLSNPAVAVGIAAFTKDLLFKEKYVAKFL